MSSKCFIVTGELERLRRFWLAGACHVKRKRGQSSHTIGIPNFTSAFILLASGVLLGGLVLLMEHLYFKFGRRCLRKYDKNLCCSLVSLVSTYTQLVGFRKTTGYTSLQFEVFNIILLYMFIKFIYEIRTFKTVFQFILQLNVWGFFFMSIANESQNKTRSELNSF